MDIQDAMRTYGVRGKDTPAENMHLTLAFIGEYDDPELVKEVVESIEIRPFELKLKGIGAFFSLILGGLGLLTAYLPYYGLNYVNSHFPSLFHLAVLAFTGVYVAVAKLTDFSRDQKLDKKFVNEALAQQDIKTTLLEIFHLIFSKLFSRRYKLHHGIDIPINYEQALMKGLAV